MQLRYSYRLHPTPSQQVSLARAFGCKWYSGTDLHKLWNEAKKADPGLSWWSENSKCAYQEAFRDLDRALKDFVKSRRGERKGKRFGFPRFKKRGKCRDSFRFSTGVIRCDRGAVTLPRLGAIATHEPTRKQELSNFFERRVSAYQVGVSGTVTFDEDF